MSVLLAPLIRNTNVPSAPPTDNYRVSQLLGLTLELCTFFVEHHSYHCSAYFIGKNVLRRVLVLLKSRHTFLRLAALRLFRRVVAMKDNYYNRYLIQHNLFEPIVEAFNCNGNRYNLLNSAIIELFEYIQYVSIPACPPRSPPLTATLTVPLTTPLCEYLSSTIFTFGLLLCLPTLQHSPIPHHCNTHNYHPTHTGSYQISNYPYTPNKPRPMPPHKKIPNY